MVDSTTSSEAARPHGSHDCPPRLALVGCGAAAQEFFLPVLKRYDPHGQSVVLVDRHAEQAQTLAKQHGFAHYCTDIERLPWKVEAAVVATPHRFHAPQAIHFLTQGTHVFVEKPLGMTAAETEAMLSAASRTQARLMVNNYRRLFASYQGVHRLLRDGSCGPVQRITVHDGTKFAWPSASAFYLRDPLARGVFLDRGAHTVDVLCWWLNEVPQVVSAAHDARGGVEGLMDVLLRTGDGVPIDLKFSRYQRLANTYRIECQQATIAGRLFDHGRFQVTRGGQHETIVAGPSRPHYEYGRQLLENFLAVVRGQQQPLFQAADVAPSIGVIEQAYAMAEPLPQPWLDNDPNVQWLQRQTDSMS